MKSVILPAAIAALLICVVTVVEGVYLRDRWGKPGAEAAVLGERFAQVPRQIDQWKGIDVPVDKIVQERSGAVRFVNRRYTDEANNRVVDLWLIIGHSRDIIRHTPDICYASSGFHAQGRKLKHTIAYGDGKEAKFYTSRFQKEDALVRQTQRVYWAWNHPDKHQWEAPDTPRYYYGMAARALYKMYFTSAATTDEKTVEDNACVEFAELILPEIDAALFPEDVVGDATAATSVDEQDAAPGTVDDLADSTTDTEADSSETE